MALQTTTPEPNLLIVPPHDVETDGALTPDVARDPLLERLVQSLLPPDQAKEVMRGFYTDALHATLLKRLAEIRREPAAGPSGRKTMPLPIWRLRRVYEFVDQHLEDRISLAALAQAAGLSRMHFAALFRAATGLRPHDYVIRRRIQRAKEMLSGSDTSIVEIALSVGFQTQAHFTTVFKRLVGFTPYQWRLLRTTETFGTD